MPRIFAMGTAMLALAALCAPACSGSAQKDAAEQPAQQQPSEQEVAQAKLRSRQEAACQNVGKAVFECAVEDARATMAPEEFAKLDVQQLEPEHMQQFMDECTSADMSARQVSVYETCLEDTRCTVFVPCLDGARPQQSAPTGEPDHGAP
jgi:hypothetical protein